MLATNKKARIEEQEHDPTSDWKEVYVASKDREDTNQSTSDFRVQLRDWKHWVDAVVLEQVHIPALYNIDASNNTFILDEGGGPLTATIAPGGYSTGSGAVLFQGAIKNALDAAGANTYSVVYDNNTYKLTISRSAGVATFFLDFTNSPELACIMGFNQGVTTTGTTVTADFPLDLSIDDLFMDIEELGNSGRNNAANTFHYTFRLPLDEDVFNVKNTMFRTKQLTNQTKIFDEPRTIQTLTVKIKDQFGQIKDFQGANWSFILKYRESNRGN